MDRLQVDRLPQVEQRPSIGTQLVCGIALLYILHQVFAYFDFAILSPQELLWNVVVYILPKPLLLDRARRQELKANDMLSQTHAAKSEALRRMMGLSGNVVMQSLPGAGEGGIMRRASMLAGMKPQVTTDAPAGLGNWDNSCYQNSVLQGLAALDSFKPYLRRASISEESSTTKTLLQTINRLNDPLNNGRQLWTPAKLKNMSSWQQQDAQEYFSKIMDELDKESAKSLSTLQPKPGLESVSESSISTTDSADPPAELTDEGKTISDRQNPLDGLLAQRVVCTRCGFSEGLSMIPFNCLTLPLGSSFAYDLEECLDEYTKLEEISDVECSKCTLLRAEQQLEQMLPHPPCYQNVDESLPCTTEDAHKVMQLPPDLRVQAFQRLRAIQQALDNDDFADKTLNETCQIPKKARVSSTKTRQAVIGRAPQNLVVHVNRSVFDEMTGAQRKNYASVRYPHVLDLSEWILSDDTNGGSMLSAQDGSSQSDVGVKYRLKAAVTHYGRHENGHYICYRQHPVAHMRAGQDPSVDGDDNVEANHSPTQDDSTEQRWWRLSDEDVSPVSEQEVLAQGGVFMLFYERESTPNIPDGLESSSLDITEPAQATAGAENAHLSADTKTEDHPVTDTTDPASTILRHDAETMAQATEMSTTTSEASTTSSPSSPLDAPSTEATTEDESESEALPSEWEPPKTQSPPLMRTAGANQAPPASKGFGGGVSPFRPVAAT